MTDHFHWPLRVYWEDTDAGGVVFYANYLKFFERARTEWLRHWGLSQHALRAETGGMFVVTRTEVAYRAPARLDDRLSVSVALMRRGRASLELHQVAWRTCETDAPITHDTRVCLCEGTISLAWVDAHTLKPLKMPQALLAELDAL
jgi:acyl-CoA thioester hydrolase